MIAAVRHVSPEMVGGISEEISKQLRGEHIDDDKAILLAYRALLASGSQPVSFVAGVG